MPNHPPMAPPVRSPQDGNPHPWRAFFQVLSVLWIVSEALFAYGDWTGQTLAGKWAGGGLAGVVLGAVIWLLFATQCALVVWGSQRLLRPLVAWANEGPGKKKLVLGACILFGVGCLLGLWILLPPFLILIWLLLGVIGLLVMAWANRAAPPYRQSIPNRNGA
jgi:hypothetical protein